MKTLHVYDRYMDAATKQLRYTAKFKRPSYKTYVEILVEFYNGEVFQQKFFNWRVLYGELFTCFKKCMNQKRCAMSALGYVSGLKSK